MFVLFVLLKLYVYVLNDQLCAFLEPVFSYPIMTCAVKLAYRS